MELEEAFEILTEIAEGDKEIVALECVKHSMEAYRSLYEGAEKRLMKFRDIALMPDLSLKIYNKDEYNDLALAKEAYLSSGSRDSFEGWLFSIARGK